MPLSLIQGETAPIQYQLLADGVAADLTGATVAISITDRRGIEASSTGTVSVVDSTDGQVTFTPATTGDFTRARSPYSVRFTVETPSGTVYFPNAATPEYWIVSV